MEVTYQKECGGMILSECHGEHHLPDYLGDMKKVLSTSARVVPAGKFIGGEEVQFGGTVVFDVWYLDAENRLSHESFNVDYELSCPCGGDSVDGAASVSVSSFSLRPIGPRRMSAKAALKAEVCLRRKESYICENEGEEPALHTAPRELLVGHRCFSAPAEREYGEQISLPYAYAGAEILYSEGNLHIERAEAKENAVSVCGSYAVSVILGAEGMPPLRLSGTYPLEEQIELDGAHPDMCATANGFFTSLTCNLREGEEPMLTFHGICELSACADGNDAVSVIEDAFLEGGSTCESEMLSFDTFGRSGMLCRTAELVLPLSEGEGSIADGVFHTTAFLKNQAHERVDSEIKYTAEAEICALGYSAGEDGGAHYASRRILAPIALSLPWEVAAGEDEEISILASVGACEGRVEEDRLHVSVWLCFAVSGRSEREIRCIRRVSPLASAARDFVPTYAVYYPQPQDTLWSIAKRYGVSPSAVAACNRLSLQASGSGESLPASLLIDKRKRTN